MKSSIPSYLNKYTLYEPLILDKPNPDLSLVIVIPSYKEDYLFQALESLLLCVRPDASIEIIPNQKLFRTMNFINNNIISY